MKTILIPFEVKLDDLVAVVGPHIMQVQRDAEREEDAALLRRPHVQALIHAGRTLSKALKRYETSVGTRDERSALNALIAASKGVRSAVKNIKD